MKPPPTPPVQCFFLQARQGGRYCLYHPAAPGTVRQGAILYVHPFAEELNSSRRMAALQSRAFAQAGHDVLQIDLHGCGDSSGDFGDARWEGWRDDLALAWDWLGRHGATPRYLWGLRLGALLALEFSVLARPRPQGLLWWQPVLNGKAHLHQFMRMERAARLLADDLPPARQELEADIEIGGYTLAAALRTALECADAAQWAPPCPVYWLERAVPAWNGGGRDPSQSGLAPASAALATQWAEQGVPVQLRALPTQAFWATSEVSECQALLAATAQLELA
ncbi:hydrolase 2, exosortase A system-associated [Oxalobacteraceae bacterium A2-2]